MAREGDREKIKKYRNREKRKRAREKERKRVRQTERQTDRQTNIKREGGRVVEGRRGRE